eukprot:665573_1
MAAFCSAPYACLSATFSASANTSSTTLSCTEKNACADMIVTVDHDGYFNDSNTSFNIYCTDPSACIDMDITFRDVSNKNHYGIHCVAPDSCTNLKITTSAEKTQLIMYEHSDNIVFDNGIGYLSADNNVECNTNRYIKFQGDMNETVDSVSTAVMNEYMNGLPCSDIQILCGNKACGMTYHVNPTKIQSLNTELNYAGCYWINVDIIQDFWCEGECEYSPTPPPTFTPTQQPTQPTSNPSMSPSSAPTISPSSAPPIFRPFLHLRVHLFLLPLHHQVSQQVYHRRRHHYRPPIHLQYHHRFHHPIFHLFHLPMRHHIRHQSRRPLLPHFLHPLHLHFHHPLHHPMLHLSHLLMHHPIRHRILLHLP